MTKKKKQKRPEQLIRHTWDRKPQTQIMPNKKKTNHRKRKHKKSPPNGGLFHL